MTQEEYNTIFSTLQTLRKIIEVWIEKLIAKGMATESSLCHLPDWASDNNFQYNAESAEKRISTLIMTFNDCYLKKVYTILTKSDPDVSTWSILDRGIVHEVNVTLQLVEGIMKAHWSVLTIVLDTDPLQANSTIDHISSKLKQIRLYLELQPYMKHNKKK